MVDRLLELPTVIGCLIVMGIAVMVGLVTYLGSYRLLFNRRSEEQADATRAIFLAIGLLVGLFLSLTFANVVVELNTIKRSVEREAITISELHHKLQRFDSSQADLIQTLLITYTQAAIENDWPALANDRLSDQTEHLLRQLELAILDLEPTNVVQEKSWDRLITDVDRIADYRLSRLEQALAHPPFFLIVVCCGFFLTMVCLGIHPPARSLIVLIALYMTFVGLIIYLILAFSDPFQGVPGIDPAPLEYVLQQMQTEDPPTPQAW